MPEILNVYTLVVILLVGFIVLIWLIFQGTNCIKPPACPTCPSCPDLKFPNGMSIEGCVISAQENDYMKDMIRYMTLIIKRYEAENELYVLSKGYAQVYNSPKLDYIKNELRRMLKEVKANPKKRTFFEKNLNNIIE